jgi:hypothetical protein
MRQVLAWEINNGLVQVKLVGATDLIWLSYIDFKDRYVEYKLSTELSECNHSCIGFLRDA